MKLTRRRLRKLIQEAAYDYETELSKRSERYKNVDPVRKELVSQLLDPKDPETRAQGEQFVDHLTGYQGSGMSDIEGFERFKLGEMYNMIPGLDELGLSVDPEKKTFHDKLVSVLNDDVIHLYASLGKSHYLPKEEVNQILKQIKRIQSEGMSPNDLDDLRLLGIHNKSYTAFGQDDFEKGLAIMSDKDPILQKEIKKAIMEYIMKYANKYDIQVNYY